MALAYRVDYRCDLPFMHRAILPTRVRRRKHLRPPSPLRSSRARAAPSANIVCASPSSINRPAAPPTAAILSVTAQDLTVMLLGEKWGAAGLLLSIIALRGIPHVVESSQGWLHLSIGTADRWRNWGIVTLVIQIVTVLAGLPFGATGVAVAVVMTGLLLAVPSTSYAGRRTDIDAALVIGAVGRQLVGAVRTVAGGWWLQTTSIFTPLCSLRTDLEELLEFGSVFLFEHLSVHKLHLKGSGMHFGIRAGAS